MTLRVPGEGLSRVWRHAPRFVFTTTRAKAWTVYPDALPATFARFRSNPGDVCKIQRNDGVNFNKAPAKTQLCSENF